MKDVCVITGGGSGIGFATAKAMGEKGYFIVLVGRNYSKLEEAANELAKNGVKAKGISCDISDSDCTFDLAIEASKLGNVRVVIHAAGLSPHMGDARKILEVNALGTINVNNAFYEVMNDGGCVIEHGIHICLSYS